MSYLVLARKYRPQSFNDLVGQSHVALTLASAIAQERIAHAFLFTGVRGVGKTTSARLLAKCLNCLGSDGKAKGPTSEPCQTCAACTEIAAGTDMDVQEIDGASYNGVDEVRKLQEGVLFRPARDRFKIYIVDEVHMLSNAAWNAFLKTLEEPPPHVKFIFATTDVHKVPVTILSRCQRYDFKLIDTKVISERLKEVLAQEKIKYEDSALAIVAREAAGSMRDAMSLLDQVIAYSGADLKAESVAKVLGVADHKAMEDLLGALLGGDASAVLTLIDALAKEGLDMLHLAKDVLEQLRNVVVRKAQGGDGPALAALPDEERRMAQSLAERAELDDLLRVYQGFSKSFDEVARSGHVRHALEMTLVRLSRRPALLPLDELLSRLGDLEKRIAAGAPPPGPKGGGGGGSGSPARRPSITAEPAMSFESFVPPQSGGGHTGQTPSEPPRMLRAIAGEGRRTGSQGAAAVHLFVAPQAPSAPESSAQPVSSPSAPPPPPAETPGDELLLPWRAVLARLRTEHLPSAAVFDHASPVEITKDLVVVAFEAASFLGGQAQAPVHFGAFERAARGHFENEALVVRVDSPKEPPRYASVAAIETARKREATAAAKREVENHPLVRLAIQLFDGELREVKVPDDL